MGGFEELEAMGNMFGGGGGAGFGFGGGGGGGGGGGNMLGGSPLRSGPPRAGGGDGGGGGGRKRPRQQSPPSRSDFEDFEDFEVSKKKVVRKPLKTITIDDDEEEEGGGAVAPMYKKIKIKTMANPIVPPAPPAPPSPNINNKKQVTEESSYFSSFGTGRKLGGH